MPPDRRRRPGGVRRAVWFMRRAPRLILWAKTTVFACRGSRAAEISDGTLDRWQLRAEAYVQCDGKIERVGKESVLRWRLTFGGTTPIVMR